jgi:hypothetical protein
MGHPAFLRDWVVLLLVVLTDSRGHLYSTGNLLSTSYVPIFFWINRTPWRIKAIPVRHLEIIW